MISPSQLIQALEAAGLSRGSTIFCHSNLAFFGAFENCESISAIAEMFFDSIIDVIGDEGNLVCPMFTYSFGSDKTEKVFDISQNAHGMCPMGNLLLQKGIGVRSSDPMLSVLCFGKDQQRLAEFNEKICFGPNSIWAKLHELDALICNFNFDSGSTFIHWVERELKVPYRQDVELKGTIKTLSESYHETVIYSGRDLNDVASSAHFEEYHMRCLEARVSKKVPLGRGQIVSQRCQDAYTFIGRLLQSDPGILTIGK